MICGWKPGDVQEDIHLVHGETLCLGQEEISPYGCDNHPGCEEEPSSVAEGAEDVRHGLGNGKLSSPLTLLMTPSYECSVAGTTNQTTRAA